MRRRAHQFAYMRPLVPDVCPWPMRFLTFEIIAGAGGASQAKKQQDLTASVMHHTGGRWLVGIAGLVIVIAGLTLVVEGSAASS